MSSKKSKKSNKSTTYKINQVENDLLESPSYSGNIETIRVTKKGLTDGYKPYMPEELTASAKKALNYSLTMIMGHVADFHTLVLHIISKKYGHTIEEMLDCVMEHPDTEKLTRHPILRDLWCNFTEDDIPKDLQRHADGLHVDEPPAPYYSSEAAVAAVAAVEDAEAVTATATATATAKKAVKAEAVKAVKSKKAVKTAKKSTAISDVFETSDEE